MTFVRTAPKGRCAYSEAVVGPLFANAKCRARAEWAFDGHPEYRGLCTRHMLAHLPGPSDRATPVLCGGIHFCRDWQVCQAECQGDGNRRGCRAMEHPAFAHIRVARSGATGRLNRSFAKRGATA